MCHTAVFVKQKKMQTTNALYMLAASAGVKFVYVNTQAQWNKKNANKCCPHTGVQ